MVGLLIQFLQLTVIKRAILPWLLLEHLQLDIKIVGI